MTRSADAAPSPRLDAAVQMLRERAERVTVARRAVLEVLDGTEEHLNADEIAARAAAAAPGLHRATVYRALTRLGELEMVTHTHVGGAATVYHLSVIGTDVERGQHTHLQCTSCSVVIDIPADVLHPLASRLLNDLDFRLAPEHAALLGTCAACRATESTP